jgi:hypothetical protein
MWLARWTNCATSWPHVEVLDLARPAFGWVPDYVSTNGDIAAQVGAELGVTPDAQQRLILDAMFAEDARHLPACFSVTAISPRQNLKTATLEIAALTDLLVLREPLHTWTAHLFKTARASFEHMCSMIESNDYFRKQCRRPHTANGNESIELLTGERIEFAARSKGGGRGRTGYKITFDEALFLSSLEIGAILPTLVTIRSAQVRYGSSAGMASSDVLRDIRDRGRAGGPRIGYYEWCAPWTECEQRDCPHMPADEIPGCALDDRELWAIANPAYGRRITEEALISMRQEMTPAEFQREFLGWWEDPDDGSSVAIPLDLWEIASDADGQIEGPVSFALALADDQSWAVIAIAGLRSDGNRQVRLVENRRGTAWVADRLVELVRDYPNAEFAVDPSSPAGALITQLGERRVEPVQIVGRELAQACGELLNGVVEGSVRHDGNAALALAVRMAQTRSASDAWVFSQRNSAVDISPLMAVTLALHLHARRFPGRYDPLDSFY